MYLDFSGYKQIGRDFATGNAGVTADEMSMRVGATPCSTHWVENGVAPSRIDISSAVSTTFPVAKSRPICLYPSKAKYIGGDVNVASSYTCAH
jgi:feruloyl esterase